MKFPLSALQAAYYTALNGNISVNSTNIPVYDHVPEDAEPDFIRIGEMTAIEAPDKSNYGWDVTVLLDVVTDYTGKKRLQDIINEITKIIRLRSDNLLSLGASWNHYKTMVDNMNTLEELTDTGKLYRGLIRFRHEIEEL